MANPTKNNLGVFAAGEIPYPFVHTFNTKDASGNKVPIDLTGFTASITFEGPDETKTYGTGTLAITDAANGEVTYTWAAGDFQDVGNYRFLIWVQNGTNRFASDLNVYHVYDGPGPTPT